MTTLLGLYRPINTIAPYGGCNALPNEREWAQNAFSMIILMAMGISELILYGCMSLCSSITSRCSCSNNGCVMSIYDSGVVKDELKAEVEVLTEFDTRVYTSAHSAGCFVI